MVLLGSKTFGLRRKKRGAIMKVLKRVIVASVILVICTGAYATPFTPAVAGDVYGVAQGGAVNGIPTARDNNDGIPDINDAINLVQGSALLRNKDADPLFVEPDYVWKQLDGTIVLIGLTAGNLNTIGYYTDLGTGAVQTPLLGPFSGFGFAGPPFPATTIGGDTSAQGYRKGLTLACCGHVSSIRISIPFTRAIDTHPLFMLRLEHA